jgi:Tol biopolymer transport system component
MEETTWTPDGRIVYGNYTRGYAGVVNIGVMGPDGGSAKQLTFNTGGFITCLRVSPDGRYIAFVSDHTGFHVWRIDIDGGNPKQLTSSAVDSLSCLDFSPDGRWVVYAKWGAEKGIWRVPIEGGDPVQLNDADAEDPAISPDGKMIAYFYRDRSLIPPQGVAITAFEGGTTKRLEIPLALKILRWATDSRSFLYTRNEGGVDNIWSQPIAGGTPKRITHFNTDIIDSFDLSRDGKRIVMDRGPATSDAVLLRDVR